MQITSVLIAFIIKTTTSLWTFLHSALITLSIVLGERLTEDQVYEVFDDCMPEEDDEGQIDYERK